MTPSPERTPLAGDRNSYRDILTTIIGLSLLTVLAYSGTLTNGFVNYDDPKYVSENVNVLGGLTTRAWHYAWTTFETGNWIPMTWLSLQLDASIFGTRAEGYHATSLLIHVANSYLIFTALARMTGNSIRSSLVAAMFLVHPLHVESVAWVSERKDVLSTLFLLLTILAYDHYTRRPNLGRYLHVCLIFAMGLLSKSMLVTTPFLLLLIDGWPLSRFAKIKGDVKKQNDRLGSRLPFVDKLPLILLAAIDGLVTLQAQMSAQAVADVENLPPSIRIGTALNSYCWYLWKTLVPTDLIPFYQYPDNGMNWSLVGCSAVFLIGTSIVVSLGSSRNARFFGWWWFVISLLPVIGLVQVGSQAHADRYSYIPHIGLLTFLVWEIADRLQQSRPLRQLRMLLAILVLCLWTWLTMKQVAIWKSSDTLWQHALSVDPENSFAHIMMGNDQRKSGELDSARAHYTSALKRWPQSHQVHNYLSALAAAEGKLEEAERHSRLALQYHPASGVAALNLSILLAHQERTNEAKQTLLNFLRLRPQDLKVRTALGVIYQQVGEFQNAWDQFERVLSASPNDSDALNHGAYVLGSLRRLPEAQNLLARLLRRQPENIDALLNSAIIAEQTGDRDLAKSRYQAVLRIKPDHSQSARRLRELDSSRSN